MPASKFVHFCLRSSDSQCVFVALILSWSLHQCIDLKGHISVQLCLLIWFWGGKSVPRRPPFETGSMQFGSPRFDYQTNQESSPSSVQAECSLSLSLSTSVPLSLTRLYLSLSIWTIYMYIHTYMYGRKYVQSSTWLQLRVTDGW